MSVSKDNNDNKADNDHHNKNNDKNKWYFVVFKLLLDLFFPLIPMTSLV